METRYCMRCASPLEEAVPDGDDRPRLVCRACQWVHYVNPRTVVGALIESGEGVLLCRRAIEPALGKWTPPAGFLEVGESSEAGAARETWEEACARIQTLRPFAHFDLPDLGQIYRFHLARLLEPDFRPGPESEEVAWFAWEEVPWEELAFPVVRAALELRLQDLREGRVCLHEAALVWNGRPSAFDLSNYRLDPHRRLVLAEEEDRS